MKDFLEKVMQKMVAGDSTFDGLAKKEIGTIQSQILEAASHGKRSLEFVPPKEVETKEQARMFTSALRRAGLQSFEFILTQYGGEYTGKIMIRWPKPDTYARRQKDTQKKEAQNA